MAPKRKGGKGKSGGSSPVTEGEAFPEHVDPAADAAAPGDTEETILSTSGKALRLPAVMITHAPTRYRPNVDEVVVESLDMAVGGKPLLENAKLELYRGNRYAIVGPNGCGKTSLLRALGNGQVSFPPHLTYWHVKEAVPASEVSAIDTVLRDVEKEKEKLEAELAELTTAEDAEARMDQIYARLDELEPETALPKASKILFGLGFTDAMQQQPTSSFSGGWRMRISLAEALFKNPMLLILDAPTAHLDLEAICWLESYLTKFENILLLVSQSASFLNSGVITHIIQWVTTGSAKKNTLTYWPGDYDNYEEARFELETHQAKNHATEQKAIAHMKDYIRRFEHANEKRSRQAQSKMKVLAKMEREGLTEAVEAEKNVNFVFQCAGKLPPPIIQFADVGFNYPGCKKLYTGLNLGVDSDSRICLVGPNGAGKTTLTKMMIRELEATEGTVGLNAHCRIARFHQHFVDLIDLSKSPLEWMQSEYPDIKDPQPLRTALGRFGVSGPLQSMPMCEMSDGQKSRVVFGWMSFREPHMLILDEPTNCLDMDSIDALADGIKDFEGAVVVVSHDLRLISQIADEIWICDKGQVKRFDGDIAAYQKHVQAEVKAHEAAHDKKMKMATSATGNVVIKKAAA